ncbi:MAG: HAD-IA family hydrolase [Pseudomonadota bacterium]
MSHSDFNWSRIRLLSFDTFGTLIDWEAGILAAAPDLADAAGNETLLAAFGETELAVQRRHPSKRYRDVLMLVYAELCDRFNLPCNTVRQRRFGLSVPDWPAFGDTRSALEYLRQHFLVVTLTNCDRLSYAGTVTTLGFEWDAIYTAEDIGSYKPDLRNFDYLLAAVHRDFRVLPGELLHVAQSLTHDHVPATQRGLANCWINRRGSRQGGATAPPDQPYTLALTFPTLNALVQAHRTGQGA